jgi:hypothetical protein
MHDVADCMTDRMCLAYVYREGGQGEGQFRTDRAGSIGKIATGRTLQEEEEASRQGLARSRRAMRSEIVKKAKVGYTISLTQSPSSKYRHVTPVLFARDKMTER